MIRPPPRSTLFPYPPLSRPPAKARAEAAPLRDDALVRRALPAPGGLPAVPSDAYPAGTDQRARAQAAPNRRDREIRPRHVLLQRRRREDLSGRGPCADSLPP